MELSCGKADTYGGVLKVVQAAVCQDEPPPLPGLHSPAFSRDNSSLDEQSQHFLFQQTLPVQLTHFQEPALSVRVKERQREVVPVVLWDFERLAADARVQLLDI